MITASPSLSRQSQEISVDSIRELQARKRPQGVMLATVVVAFFSCMLAMLGALRAFGDEPPLRVYVDADYSNHLESSMSIERGAEVALELGRHKLNGRNIELVRKDHRGNSLRSKRHIQDYLEDPHALAMLSGIHSPPLLANRELINREEVLFLVPWAAAGSITRPEAEENWIYRLSVDDTKAGAFITDYVIEDLGYRKPRLVLEDTGWGKSNFSNMTLALRKQGITNPDISWFDWGLGEATAASIRDDAIANSNDVIIFVGNALEGALFAQTFAQPLAGKSAIPMISHWGITGGNFHEKVPYALREVIDLQFLQTRFSFLADKLTPFQDQVLNKAIAEYEDIGEAKDIRSPTGFIHAFDLMSLMVSALSQIELSGEIEVDRRSARLALENLEQPVDGLLKRYERPFSAYDSSSRDSHEALSERDYAIGMFGPHSEIQLVQKGSGR